MKNIKSNILLIISIVILIANITVCMLIINGLWKYILKGSLNIQYAYYLFPLGFFIFISPIILIYKIVVTNSDEYNKLIDYVSFLSLIFPYFSILFFSGFLGYFTNRPFNYGYLINSIIIIIIELIFIFFIKIVKNKIKFRIKIIYFFIKILLGILIFVIMFLFTYLFSFN